MKQLGKGRLPTFVLCLTGGVCEEVVGVFQLIHDVV